MNENDLVWEEVEVVKGSGRTTKGVCLRISHRMLVKNLTGNQIQAGKDIERAYNDLARGFGYVLVGVKPTNLEGVGGGETPEEIIDAMRARLGKLHEWELQCKSDWKNAVSAIHEHHMTATNYAKSIPRPVKTIMEWYRRGLDEYCDLRGWRVHE